MHGKPAISRMYQPPQFDAIRDEGEEFLWTGKPSLIPFLLQDPEQLIWLLTPPGLVLGALLLAGLTDKPVQWNDSAIVPLIIFVAIPLLLLSLKLLLTWLAYRLTWYAITDRRVIIRSGFLLPGFRVFDYDRLPEYEVTMGPIERLCDVATITFMSFDRDDTAGQPCDARQLRLLPAIYHRFIAIRRPFHVFQRLKQIEVDVKTDWAFPNALRPQENPGIRRSPES